MSSRLLLLRDLAKTLARSLRLAASVGARTGAALSGTLIVTMVIIIIVEITMRNLLGRSSQMVEEFTGYGVAAVGFLGLAQALRNGELVRVNLMYEVAERVGFGTRSLDVVNLSLSVAIMLVLVWYFSSQIGLDYARERSSGTIMDVPLWMPKLLILLGMLILTLQLLSLLADRLFLRGDGDGALPAEHGGHQ